MRSTLRGKYDRSDAAAVTSYHCCHRCRAAALQRRYRFFIWRYIAPRNERVSRRCFCRSRRVRLSRHQFALQARTMVFIIRMRCCRYIRRIVASVRYPHDSHRYATGQRDSDTAAALMSQRSARSSTMPSVSRALMLTTRRLTSKHIMMPRAHASCRLTHVPTMIPLPL